MPALTRRSSRSVSRSPSLAVGGCGKGDDLAAAAIRRRRRSIPADVGWQRLRLRLGRRRRRRHARRARPMCRHDAVASRCAAPVRSYAGSTALTLNGHEKSVTLIGDYRTDSWTNGDAATFDGSKWVVTVALAVGDGRCNTSFTSSTINGAPDGYLARSVEPDAGPRRLRRHELGVQRHDVRDVDLRRRRRSRAPACRCRRRSFDWRDAVIYWAFVDRFVDGDPPTTAHHAIRKLTGTAANWQGGDWAGAARRRSTTATSPSSASTRSGSRRRSTTPTARTSAPTATLYSGYHGYWPQT